MGHEKQLDTCIEAQYASLAALGMVRLPERITCFCFNGIFKILVRPEMRHIVRGNNQRLILPYQSSRGFIAPLRVERAESWNKDGLGTPERVHYCGHKVNHDGRGLSFVLHRFDGGTINGFGFGHG